jgi:hypothetical protein
VIVAERDVEPVFAAYEYAIDALPEPDALPALTVSHDWLLVAVHAHVEALAVSAMLPDPAVAGAEAVDDASVYVHVPPPGGVARYGWSVGRLAARPHRCARYPSSFCRSPTDSADCTITTSAMSPFR